MDDYFKVNLGHRLARFISQEQEAKIALSKKLNELSALRQLAATYRDTPQFGNPESPLEQLADHENIVELMNVSYDRLCAQIKFLETSNVTPIKPSSSSMSPTFTSFNAFMWPCIVMKLKTPKKFLLRRERNCCSLKKKQEDGSK